jgi:hypothetical protein
VKYLSVAILAGAAGWYYLIDGSKLDEPMVRQFYEEQSRHTHERDPEALCSLLGRRVSVRMEARIGGKVTTTSYGKGAACRQLRSSFKFFEDMGDKAGGILTIEYNYDISRLERSLRKVQLVEEDAKVHMRWTPGAISHPEQYFQAQ